MGATLGRRIKKPRRGTAKKAKVDPLSALGDVQRRGDIPRWMIYRAMQDLLRAQTKSVRTFLRLEEQFEEHVRRIWLCLVSTTNIDYDESQQASMDEDDADDEDKDNNDGNDKDKEGEDNYTGEANLGRTEAAAQVGETGHVVFDPSKDAEVVATSSSLDTDADLFDDIIDEFMDNEEEETEKDADDDDDDKGLQGTSDVRIENQIDDLDLSTIFSPLFLPFDHRSSTARKPGVVYGEIKKKIYKLNPKMLLIVLYFALLETGQAVMLADIRRMVMEGIIPLAHSSHLLSLPIRRYLESTRLDVLFRGRVRHRARLIILHSA